VKIISRLRVAGHLPHREKEMGLADFAGPRDPAAAVILTVQTESLAKFGQELLAKQRAAMAQMETEMERTIVDMNDRLATWRRRLIFTIHASFVLLVPWLVALALLVASTLFLGVKAREAWGDYRTAVNAADRMRMHGAVTVLKDGELYVRVDRGSLVQGRGGNWYARAARLDLRETEVTP
jgi:hypothetical protein